MHDSSFFKGRDFTLFNGTLNAFKETTDKIELIQLKYFLWILIHIYENHPIRTIFWLYMYRMYSMCHPTSDICNSHNGIIETFFNKWYLFVYWKCFLEIPLIFIVLFLRRVDYISFDLFMPAVTCKMPFLVAYLPLVAPTSIFLRSLLFCVWTLPRYILPILLLGLIFCHGPHLSFIFYLSCSISLSCTAFVLL